MNTVPDGEDLYFISADKDYRSIMSDYSFNPFLKKEWKVKKNSDIVFYKDLITFLNVHIKIIKLKTEEEKEELINQLSKSKNFVSTHGVIAMLAKHTGWTETQIERLCSVAENNRQVSWILGDGDICQFYWELLANIEYDKLPDCATKRIFDRIKHMDDVAEANDDYNADVMDTLEDFFNH